MSRERRSPEIFHPPRLAANESDYNMQITLPERLVPSRAVPFYAGQISKQKSLEEKKELERSLRVVSARGKLDQNVSSESQHLKLEESQDFEFDQGD